MREFGHRKPLTIENGARQSSAPKPNGYIEPVAGRYVHLSLDGHDYRVFYEAGRQMASCSFFYMPQIQTHACGGTSSVTLT
jgi:hypothetical protein